MTLYTIGHSNLTADRFINLLVRHGVTAVCDVRSTPRSRSNPQFDKDDLKQALRAFDIEYVFLGKELGARPKDRSVYVEGKASYELISRTDYFKSGLERVRKGSERYTVALMCAEKDPITCHRTILVARYLTDLRVSHILQTGDLELHEDAMKRLLRSLGVRAQLDEVSRALIEQAYETQGKRICYSDFGFEKQRAAVGTFL